MSEVSNSDTQDTSSAENESPNEQTVSYDSFQKVLAQRKADQAKAKELEDKLAKIEADRQAETEAKLKENQEWKSLAEQKSKQLEQALAEKQATEKKWIDNHKLNSFLSEVGGLRNPEYSKFIDYSKILVNDDGTINADSVKNYANEFRESYSDLIKPSDAKPLPSDAPKDTATPTKSLSELTEAELKALYISTK